MTDQQTSQDVLGTPQTVEETPPPGSVEPALNVESYEPPPVDPSGGAIPTPPGGLNLRFIVIIVLGILVIAGVVLGIIAFVGGGEGVSDKVTITYWGLWEPEEVMQTVIDDYERENPGIYITYKMNSPIQYRERLQAAIERGEGPDIFRFHNTWVPMLKNDLSSVPPSVMSVDDAKAIYYSGIVDDLERNGQMVAIPYGVDTLMLFYNKEIFSRNGISVPVTWNDFNRTAAVLTIKRDDGSIVRAGAAIGTAENIDHFSDILGLIMYQNGVKFPDFSSVEASQALEVYALFAMEPENVWDENQDNSIVAFAAGDVAMMFAPSWQAHTIRALNPNLDFKTAPVPQLSGGTPVSWGTYWVEGVSAKSPRQEAAFAFLKYLSKKETMTKLYAETSKLESRLFGEPYARVDLSDKLRDQEYLSPVANQAVFMKSWYMSSKTQDNGLNDEMIGYFKDAVNAMLAGSSASGAMSVVNSGAQDILTKYGALDREL